MLIDGRQVPVGTTIETDVCIVGAGAAGIALALSLGGERFSVCLVESGGFEFDSATQALYEGENVGRSYFPLNTSRLRFFGGTTNHWGGWCRPLDASDFEVRDWVPYSGWPIQRQDLDSSYQRAHEIVRLAAFSYEASAWQGREHGNPMPLDPASIRTVMFQMAATRLGSVYRDQVLGFPNVRTIINSNVVELETSDDSRSISNARFATLTGNSFQLKARVYILACGGIENPRILLASNRAHPAGLGNENDLVGRFFMEHMEVVAAEFLPSNARFDPRFYVPHSTGVQIFGALAPTPEVLRANQMHTFAMTLMPKFPAYLDEAASSQGWESFRALGRRAAGLEAPGALTTHLWNVLLGFDRIANAAYGRLAASRVVRQYSVKINVEQQPNPDSRVTLQQNRDELGIPRAQVDWRLTERDLQTVRFGYELLAREVGRAGLGRVQIPDQLDGRDWQDVVGGAWHHMGTTRMADDPKLGVVDRSCRIHSLANLYVAGSSVFPTCGFVNPTLTILALAVRLGDTIKEVFR